MSKDNATAAMLMAIIAVRQNVYDRIQALNANTNGGVSSNTKLLISEQANTASQHTT